MGRLYNQITAVILAGGKNSRFGGRDKAFFPVDGIPMVENISGLLMEIFSRILIVTNTPERYGRYGYFSTVSDIFKDAGPLGGIHAAMTAVNTPYIFVVSCDMPCLDKSIINNQIGLFFKEQDLEAFVPRVNSKIEPLHAIYSAKLAKKLAKFLSETNDKSIRAFLAGIKVSYMDMPDDEMVARAFSNINNPQDLSGL
jgi:molybdenum cofactor guanylyltransferase